MNDKKNIIKTIVEIAIVVIGIISVVFLLSSAIDKEAKVHCLNLQSQAGEFGKTYKLWALENPEAHKRDVEMCSQYNVEIVLKD